MVIRNLSAINLHSKICCCLISIIFLSCSVRQAQDQVSLENSLVHRVSHKSSAEKRESLLVAKNQHIYFGILNGYVYEIGRLASEQTGLYMLKFSTLKDLNAAGRKLKAFQDDSGFKKVIISDVSEQRMLIETLRSLTNSDKRERGCFIRITEEKMCFRIYLEQVFNVGKEHEVDFRFPLNARGALCSTDKNGDVLIATVHSHNHDKGLSGLSKEEIADGKGDISNIKFTAIPWIVIGSTKIEAGYLTGHDVILTEELAIDNLVLYALWRVSIK